MSAHTANQIKPARATLSALTKVAIIAPSGRSYIATGTLKRAPGVLEAIMNRRDFFIGTLERC
jgi:hypothetical protein